MFREMKLNGKIISLAALLIFLTCLVSFVGYRSYSSVVSSVETSDAATGLVRSLQEMRQQEKDYIISKDSESAEGVGVQLAAIKSEATQVKKELDKKNREKMDGFLQRVDDYDAAFTNYAALEVQKNEILIQMQDRSREALSEIDGIRADLLKQLNMTRTESDLLLDQRLTIFQAANTIIQTTLKANVAVKNYQLTKDEDGLERANESINDFLDIIEGMVNQQHDEKEMEFVNDLEIKGMVYATAFYRFYAVTQGESDEKMRKGVEAELVTVSEALKISAKAMLDFQTEQLILARAETSSLINDKLSSSEDSNQIVKWFLEARGREKGFINTKTAEDRNAVTGYMNQILKLGADLKDRFTSDANIRKLETALASVRSYRESFEEFTRLMEAQDSAEETMLTSVRFAETACNDVQTDLKQGMGSQISGAKTFLVIGTLISILAGMILAYLIIRSISKGISPVIQGLSEATDQVASGSSEVATSSQALAAGASEQAAGIEEISSAMEEMSSMTKQSAENAGQADQYMKESKQVVVRANESMGRLSTSIGEISQASEKTSKIIKTIDEIAFQTNLLALNAAVEAARAGEAGAGFAVVADEVRNLAMRAAVAAKDTANLIESIVKQIKESTGLVDTTSQAFGEVTQSSDKVGALVAEISASASELSKGIEQVNESISGVDQIIQQNAASAEESASASEEMSAQAEQMKEYVQSLVDIVGSGGGGAGLIELFGRKNTTDDSEYDTMESMHKENHYLPKPKREATGRVPDKKKAREVQPHEVIPMDDDDFQDF